MHELFEFGLVFDLDLFGLLYEEIGLGRLRCLLEEQLGLLLLDVLHGVLLNHDGEACLGRRSRLSQGLASKEQGLLGHRDDHVAEDVAASLPRE